MRRYYIGQPIMVSHTVSSGVNLHGINLVPQPIEEGPISAFLTGVVRIRQYDDKMRCTTHVLIGFKQDVCSRESFALEEHVNTVVHERRDEEFFNEGFDARTLGKTMNACIYKNGTHESDKWHNGWIEANAEMAEEEAQERFMAEDAARHGG